MGPIQSSINTLIATAWGTLASASMVAKKFGKIEKPKKQGESPKTEITNSMGNNVKIGRVPKNQYMAAAATLSANNAINEKAVSSFFNVEDRVKEATSLTIKDIGGNK